MDGRGSWFQQQQQRGHVGTRRDRSGSSSGRPVLLKPSCPTEDRRRCHFGAFYLPCY